MAGKSLAVLVDEPQQNLHGQRGLLEVSFKTVMFCYSRCRLARHYYVKSLVGEVSSQRQVPVAEVFVRQVFGR